MKELNLMVKCSCYHLEVGLAVHPWVYPHLGILISQLHYISYCSTCRNIVEIRLKEMNKLIWQKNVGIYEKM